MVQVNIPVLMPGQPPLSVALLGLHKSDMRLLHVAAKLGAFIANALEQASQQVSLKLSLNDHETLAFDFDPTVSRKPCSCPCTRPEALPLLCP